MRIDKIVIRSFLSTLAAIVLLFTIMFIALVCAFPSTMMELTYDLGMDASSIRHAERAYQRSKDEYFAAYAMEVAVGANEYEKIVSSGETLIADGDFDAFCMTKNEGLGNALMDEGFVSFCQKNEVELSVVTAMGYQEYVFGQVCVAKYELGEKTQAVESAVELTFGQTETKEFAQNNALVAVLYTAIGNVDGETVEMIKGKMEQQQIESLSEGDKAYFGWVLALSGQVLAK